MRRQLKKILVAPDDDGIRPAGKPDKCFYCGRKVGKYHRLDCVTIMRPVRVKYTFDAVHLVPQSWGKRAIEVHLNETSWCADNAMIELEEIGDKLDAEGKCMCHIFKGKYVGEVNA